MDILLYCRQVVGDSEDTYKSLQHELTQIRSEYEMLEGKNRELERELATVKDDLDDKIRELNKTKAALTKLDKDKDALQVQNNDIARLIWWRPGDGACPTCYFG